MKLRIFACGLLMAIGLISYGQEVYIENGKILTNFKFKTSNGDKIDYLRQATNSIGFGFRAPFRFTRDKLYLGGGLSFNKYAASGTNVTSFHTYDWDVNYLALNITGDFDVVDLRGFRIYGKAQASGEFFLQGTQTIDGDNFDLKGEEQFDGTKIFFRAGFGVNYQVNKDVAAYMHYLIGRNFFNIGEDKSSGQDLDLSTHSIAIGVYFHLREFTQFR